MKYTYIFIIICVFISSCINNEKNNSDTCDIHLDTIKADSVHNNYLYGIRAGLYDIVKGKVKPSETLAFLLLKSGLSADTVNKLTNYAQELFTINKIKSGNLYTYFYSKEDQKINYIAYEINKTDFLVFGINDSLYVNRSAKKIDTVKILAAFSIKTTLWNTIVDMELNPNLSLQLSEIYAWTIDFFDLQEGDSIRVLYDEMSIEGESIGINKIHASYFRHANHDYYAIPFTNGKKTDYFDLEGNNLRKAFLKAPLRFSRISSKFSNSRFHPILKIYRPHFGVDYSAPIGTPVLAIGDGTVIQVSSANGAGRMVKIKHNVVYTSAYMHLNRFGNGIKQGTHVQQGQIIGYVGSSGLSTGPHLDFRMYKNGSPIDPLKVESPSVEPIQKENYPVFNEAVYLALKDLGINNEKLYYAFTSN